MRKKKGYIAGLPTDQWRLCVFYTLFLLVSPQFLFFSFLISKIATERKVKYIGAQCSRATCLSPPGSKAFSYRLRRDPVTLYVVPASRGRKLLPGGYPRYREGTSSQAPRAAGDALQRLDHGEVSVFSPLPPLRLDFLPPSMRD